MPAVPLINVDRRGAVTVVELARPETGNALATGVVTDLSSALATAQEGGARALVLTGRGRHFCTGADLRELAEGSDAPVEVLATEAARLAALYAELLRSAAVRREQLQPQKPVTSANGSKPDVDERPRRQSESESVP